MAWVRRSEPGDDDQPGDHEDRHGDRHALQRENASHRNPERTSGHSDERRDPDRAQQRRLPRNAPEQVRPSPFGRKPGGSGSEACERTAHGRTLPRRHCEDDLDNDRGTDVEGEVRHDVTQAVMDDQREQPSGGQEHHGRTQRPPTSECGTRSDQSDRRSERDEHRVIQHLPLGHAEVELKLERRQTEHQSHHEDVTEHRLLACLQARPAGLRVHQQQCDRGQGSAADHQ